MLSDGLSAILPCQNSVRSVAVHTHFHIIFMLPRHEGDTLSDCLNLQDVLYREVFAEWRRNVAPPVWSTKKQKYIPNTRSPVYKPLCTYVQKYVRGKLRTNYDLHYVNPVLSDGGTADVAFYVMKYMMKPSDRSERLRRALHLNLPKEEYEDLWSMVKPRHFESEALGLGQTRKTKLPFHVHYEVAPKIFEHLRKGIELSKHQPGEPIPSYFSPEDGTPRPLAKYYKGNGDIFTMYDYLDFFYASKQSADNVIIRDDRHLSELLQQEKDFDKMVSQVEFQQSANELDDLFADLTDDTFIDLQ